MIYLYAIIPSLFSIIAATISKRIIPSIILGLLVGCILKGGGNLLQAIDLLSYYIVGAITDENNAPVIVFLFCFGAFAEILKLGGGISAFTDKIQRYVHSERGAYLSVWIATPLTFLDCCFHAIFTGIIAKAIMEKSQGSKDKLAFILNITSSQLIPLIPFATTYVGYILGILTPTLVQSNLIINPYTLYLQSIPYNFYSITTILLSLLASFYSLENIKVLQPVYKLLPPEKGAHEKDEAKHQHNFEDKLPPRMLNIVLPLLFLLLTLTYLVLRSGEQNGGKSIIQAIRLANYDQAILSATFIALTLTTLLFVFQRLPMQVIEKAFFSGGMEMLPPILIIVLAWAMILLSKDLGFYDIIFSNLFSTYLPVQLMPFILFVISGLISYFIGSSWATWALLLPVGISIAIPSNINLPLIVGAVIAGGSVGDSISPLGEEPILVASTMDVPLTSHIRYVTPYGIIAFVVSAIGYLISGYTI